jgi:polysaccharide export outer membrane protein
MQTVERQSMEQIVTSELRQFMPRVLMILLCLAFAGIRGAHAEDYTLDTGDSLRITVFGEAAYPIEVTVDDRGSVTLPLLGDVTARNLTPVGLSNSIREAFQEQKLLINPFVQVDIRQYRPFFISGAVANPGSYPYKPGITIRHALAIAGGFQAMQIGNDAPALRIADLRAERANLLIEEYRHIVRLARLRAESRGDADFAADAERPMDIAPQFLDDIVTSEKQQMAERRSAYESDVSHINASLARAKSDAEMLTTAMKERENAAKYQLQQLESARQLQKKGLVTNTNLLTAERTQNSYQVDLAEAGVAQARARQDILNLESELRNKVSGRKMELISQIEQEQLEVAKAQSALRFVSDKLLFVSAYGQHRTFDDLRGSVKIVIYRGSDAQAQAIAANETTPVKAGDVIEVSIVANQQFYGVEPPAPSN